MYCAANGMRSTLHTFYSGMYSEYCGWCLEPATSQGEGAGGQPDIYEHGHVFHSLNDHQFSGTDRDMAETPRQASVVDRFQLCVHSVHIPRSSRDVYFQDGGIPQMARQYRLNRLPLPSWGCILTLLPHGGEQHV